MFLNIKKLLYYFGKYFILLFNGLTILYKKNFSQKVIWSRETKLVYNKNYKEGFSFIFNFNKVQFSI